MVMLREYGSGCLVQLDVVFVMRAQQRHERGVLVELRGGVNFMFGRGGVNFMFGQGGQVYEGTHSSHSRATWLRRSWLIPASAACCSQRRRRAGSARLKDQPVAGMAARKVVPISEARRLRLGWSDGMHGRAVRGVFS